MKAVICSRYVSVIFLLSNLSDNLFRTRLEYNLHFFSLDIAAPTVNKAKYFPLLFIH